jgi:hypothetical protein
LDPILAGRSAGGLAEHRLMAAVLCQLGTMPNWGEDEEEIDKRLIKLL